MIVSVIITTYRRSKCIQRAVESVLAQTISDFEVIVVDDNGINTLEGLATAKKMRKYSGDSRVKYIQHPINLNGSAARNTGIKESKGEYLSFLDDDDTYLPKRLQLLYEKLDNLDNSWGICYSSYIKKKTNGTIHQSAERVFGDIYLQALMRSFYLGSGSNIFVRKSVVDDIGLFDETFERNQDLEFLVRVLKKYKMAYVDKVLMEINYDIRISKLSFSQQCERENKFRKKFGSYIIDLSEKDQKRVLIMWNIDWIRLCLSKREYRQAIKTAFSSKIPISVFISYCHYIVDRLKNKTSYGFVVNI